MWFFRFRFSALYCYQQNEDKDHTVEMHPACRKKWHELISKLILSSVKIYAPMKNFCVARDNLLTFATMFV